jgi:DNA-binding NarL/FixJ family response regulator
MKAIIIDNEELFRLGVKSLLQAGGNFEEIIEITTGHELLSLSISDTQETRLTIFNPLCLPDHPDNFGHPVKRLCPSSAIIAMCDRSFSQFYHQGVHFIPRGISAHKMAELIQDTVSDILQTEEIHHVRRFSAHTLKALPKPSNVSDKGIKGLSKRRLQILEMASEGHSNKNISAELNIAEGTVKAHMHLIMKILNVANRTQAAKWYQNQMLSGDIQFQSGDPQMRHDY